MAAALDADAHVHVGEAGAAEEQHRLKHLEAQDLRLNQLQRDAWAKQARAQRWRGDILRQRAARGGSGAPEKVRVRADAEMDRTAHTAAR